jgi:hypothetical protein
VPSLVHSAYNNGWETTGGNGQPVYVKNSTGSKVVRDNIAFNQLGYGLHGYTNLGSGRVVGRRVATVA